MRSRVKYVFGRVWSTRLHISSSVYLIQTSLLDDVICCVLCMWLTKKLTVTPRNTVRYSRIIIAWGTAFSCRCTQGRITVTRELDHFPSRAGSLLHGNWITVAWELDHCCSGAGSLSLMSWITVTRELNHCRSGAGSRCSEVGSLSLGSWITVGRELDHSRSWDLDHYCSGARSLSLGS